VLEIVKPLVAAAQLSRSAMVEEPTPVVAPAEIGLDSPPAPDAGLVRAAVTLALEAALPVLVDEITARVLAALERDSA
jgi:predicted metal-dependent TIM-barrel fold hydrolase